MKQYPTLARWLNEAADALTAGTTTTADAHKWAAAEAHRELRWQTELRLSGRTDVTDFALERLAVLERVFRQAADHG